MVKITLDKAVNGIVYSLENFKRKPVFIGVHGTANTGKTYFSKMVCERLTEKSLVGYVTNESCYPDSFIQRCLAGESFADAIFFNQGGHFSDLLDDNLKSWSKRGADLHVFLYNPKMEELPILDEMDGDNSFIVRPESDFSLIDFYRPSKHLTFYSPYATEIRVGAFGFHEKNHLHIINGDSWDKKNPSLKLV